MLESAFFPGEMIENRFVGYVSSEHFYLILQINEGVNLEQGNKIIENFRQSSLHRNWANLSVCEAFVAHEIKKNNISAFFSASFAFLRGHLVYIKTVHEGAIFLKRASQLAKLITGNTSASGFSKQGDMLFLTTTEFNPPSLNELARMIRDNHPSKIVELFQSKSSSIIGKYAPLLLVSFQDQKQSSLEKVSDQVQEKAPFMRRKDKNWIQKLIDQYEEIKRTSEAHGNKKATFLIVILIIFILIWSVGLGYGRRRQEARQRKISQVRQVVEQKIKQASEISFLNIVQAQADLADARTQVHALQQGLGSQNQNEIDSLFAQIKQAEDRIIKKEVRQPQEFFDLTIDSKNAQGKLLALDGDNLAILDSLNGIFYILSLSKKSLDKMNASVLKEATIISLYHDVSLAFVPHQGIFSLSTNQAKKVIDTDNDWGSIVDMKLYNGNIYLLDSNKNQIYKYLVGDNAYSAKNLYFKSGAGISFDGSNSLAIDSSIYIGFNDHVLKYTGGVPETFHTSFPQSNINLTKTFTNKDLDKVYTWDKSAGAIYILDKTGSYQKEVQSNVLTRADDFSVYNNAAYILYGAKIYSISLE